MTATYPETCWTLIRGAAQGSRGDKEQFAQRYLPVVRAFLRSRWRGSRMMEEVEDVIQEVFVACFREGGALQGLDSSHGRGFG